MGRANFSLLGHLKRAAMKKLKLLIALWQMHSNSNIVAAICKQRRRYRFVNHRRGLRSCFSDDESESNNKARSEYRRATSVNAYSKWENNDDVDVDKRAEIFIANFRRQLRLERQVSLESSSCNRDGFEDDY
ncbi:hypothetical protein L6164_015843 [Bauhinia variegata]|uniref:Uncharacterized protein n=1 Tax=Bauhinia variegata TaxID=167791 RepID=A0ACB9NLR4_BAUVA|nr:hypothetical protein L6164_015843 [Bauhinia variegata]